MTTEPHRKWNDVTSREKNENTFIPRCDRCIYGVRLWYYLSNENTYYKINYFLFAPSNIVHTDT